MEPTSAQYAQRYVCAGRHVQTFTLQGTFFSLTPDSSIIFRSFMSEWEATVTQLVSCQHGDTRMYTE